MLNRTYDTQNCSVARALEVVGERWSLLLVRDLMLGFHRFDELQERLGIARNVLASRLERLTDEGVVERHLYQEHPPRHEYRLTEKGLDLWPVIVGLLSWGDRSLVDEPPVVLEHRGCGGQINDAAPWFLTVSRLRSRSRGCTAADRRRLSTSSRRTRSSTRCRCSRR